MGRKMKKLTRAGAGALAGVMVFGLAAPLAPLSVEAADEVKNLAIGSTATVNDKETDYWGADKAVDGIVNRTAAKRDQSRWATNVGGDADAKWLKIDLKEAKTSSRLFLHGKEEILPVIKSRFHRQAKIIHGKTSIQKQEQVIFLI